MTDELIVDGFSIDLTETIPVPITFAIADVKDPAKRKQSFSKEVTLPGTMANNVFFSGMFGFTATESGINFDATAKVNVILKKRGVQVLDGLLKLDSVTILNGVISYTCTVLSDSVDIFQLLSTIAVNELDWSAYNHTLNRTNIKASFTAAIGSGYYYPLIERGNGRLGTTIWRTTDIYPYVYMREVLSKCFELLDLTWDSDFLDTDQFKSILFGFGGGEIKTTAPTELNNRLINIDNGDFTGSFNTYTTNPDVNDTTVLRNITSLFTPPSWNVNPFADAVFTSTVTQDIYTQFDDGEITIEKTGTYSLATSMILDYVVNIGAATFGTITSPRLRVYKNGLEVAQIFDTTSVYYTATGTFTLNQGQPLNLGVQSGDVISFKLTFSLVSVTCGVGVAFTPPSVDITTDTPITIDLTCLDTSITDGGTVTLGRYLPAMKCSEFLLNCIRQFNLYIAEPDKDGVCLIEPLTPFYSNTNDFTDISKLIDHTKPIKIRPAANEYAKTISYKFKKSTDFDAVKYLDKWEEEYGDFNYTQGSYYAKGEQKTELTWSTIIPFEVATGILVPRFIKIENNVMKPNAGAPRIMFRNGSKTGSWTLRNTVDSSSELLTTYPCVHHFDNWQDPEFDLNFKLVSEVYYTATIVTTINCYSEYYSTFINEMTSPAGKIVDAYVYWNEIDIKNRDFGKLLMIDGALFRLNEIKEFSRDVQTTTNIELVKVLKAKKRRSKTISYGVGIATTFGGTVTSPISDAGSDTGVILTPSGTVGKHSKLITG